MDHGLDRFDLGVHCDRLGRLTRRGMYATSVVARIGAEGGRFKHGCGESSVVKRSLVALTLLIGRRFKQITAAII